MSQQPAIDPADGTHAAITVRVDDEHNARLPGVPPGRYALRAVADIRWQLTRLPDPPHPCRVVDRFGRGWLTSGPVATTHPPADREWTFAQLAAERGPLRPLAPPARDDVERMRHALVCAGSRAAGTVLLALHQVSRELYLRYGHDGLLTAGRPGSWESALLPRLANDVGAAVGDGRSDQGALATVLGVLHRWVLDRSVYVEVSENLAGVFGAVVDGRGGWDQVADQWLMGHPCDEEVRGLLLSRSRYYGPGSEHCPETR